MAPTLPPAPPVGEVLILVWELSDPAVVAPPAVQNVPCPRRMRQCCLHHRLKRHFLEEWSNAAFGEAEALAKTAAEWAVKAEEAAMKGQRYNQSENMGEIVPEEIDVNEPQPPDPFLENEERLELLDIDVDEEEE